MADVDARPNIRIEISNNLVEPMEVDEDDKNAVEDGEIQEITEKVEDTPPAPPRLLGNRIWANADGGFTTGINIFEKEEQAKLAERAKRFTLKPDEINTFTDEQLQQLHDSLGITAENEKDIRFEAIHMHGTDEMSTEDVLNYFIKYAPSGIEWIDDSSCNVVWLDKVSAARAMHYVSKAIRNLPGRGPCDPFAKELLESDKENGETGVLRNENREVELSEDKEMTDVFHKDNSVDFSEIRCPIPPGFWRLGVENPKAKYILLRFALKSDLKPYKAEKFSNYYKKYGNPNYGGMKGIISETCKQKFRGIFDRNRELPRNETANKDDKNPWGDLAETWDEDARFREREYRNPDFVEKVATPEVKNPALQERLGFKRAHTVSEEAKSEEEPKKKVKIPRMRMYADEEEQKIKRKKQLMALKSSASATSALGGSDLRNMLPERRKIPDANENLVDLGTKLKNRHKRLVIEQTDVENIEEPRIKPAKHEERRRRKSRSPDAPFRNRMHSDRHEHERRRRRASPPYPVEEFDEHKPRSKVAVVVKTQKQPTVASKIWSRISERDRLKTVSEGKLRRYTSSSSESSSDSSSSSSSSESTSESAVSPKKKGGSRPGFYGHLKSEKKSPLRIEISNDHFRKE